MNIYEKYAKRPLDILAGVTGLTLLSPVLLLTALAVRTTMGRPVIFAQPRPGRNEEMFTLLKFRTMKTEENLSDGERVTRLGAFLRKASLDELPQMINILKGEMSFVGPRPLAKQYLPYYTDNERERHQVRPGITGLAQVRGRNGLSWQQRFGYDLEYVSAITLRTDLVIVLRTILKIALKEGVIPRGEGEVRDFDAERRSESAAEHDVCGLRPTPDREERSAL